MKYYHRTLFFLFGLLILFAGRSYADEWQGITLPEEAFYSITYFGIPAGSASIRVEKVDYKGKSAIKVTARVWSSSYYSRIYRVNDVVVTIFDTVTMEPFEHWVDYEEGTYRRKTHYIFDYEKGECCSEEGIVEIHKNILDPAGALFYMRVQDLAKGLSFQKDVCDGRKLQTVEAHVVREKKIATMFGWRSSFVVKPDLKDIRREGVTKVRQKLKVYFLKDHEKIPYLVKGKLVIGSLIARLKKIEKK